MTTDYSAWKEKLANADYNQSHLLASSSEEEINTVLDQVAAAERNYPGGVLNYLQRARKLLADSKAGVNPYDGYKPSCPSFIAPEIGSEEFFDLEKCGSECVTKCAFVLVAGGLGERLGYPGIKISLPTNTVENVTYAEWYIRCILHYQERAREATGKSEMTLPLAIMTSGDTNEATVKLLEENKYFGAEKSQVTIMLQEKVPALLDNDARIALTGDKLEMKPHGHGDVHTLLHQHGLPQKWLSEGIEWCFFFQDTNALSFRALPVFLGISKKQGYAMNSLCIPRLPCDAVGGICKLAKESGETLTINVEYNQLDGLLKGAGLPGDVAAEGSEYSQYPGNCNILAFNLASYAARLTETGGAVPEFVNPKYKDATKTTFKSPTRVECMMQDFARQFGPEDKVGCTVLDRWFCFSTVKNNIADARAKIAGGNSGESAFTGEAEMYDSAVRCLSLAAMKAGVEFHAAEAQPLTFQDTSYPVGPKLYIDPSYALTISEISEKLVKTGVKAITLQANSTLVLSGNVAMDSLTVSGALRLHGDKDGSLKLGAVECKNAGVSFKEVDVTDESIPLMFRVRGYKPVGTFANLS